MAVLSYGVLAHYPSGSSDVRVVSETPMRGALLAVPEDDRWVVEDVVFREGALDGKAYTTEVWVVAALREG